MSEQNGPAGPPPAPPPGAGPAAGPGAVPGAAPGVYAGPAQPTRPMPQWYPAVPKQPFRDRLTRLWVALVAAVLCLLVGFGVGFAVGHATGDDDRGPARFHRMPGDRPHFGFRDGQPGQPGHQRQQGLPPVPQSP